MPSGFRFVSRSEGSKLRDARVRRAPYGLEIIESCLSCPQREDRLFCNLPPAAVQELASITSGVAYPRGDSGCRGPITAWCFHLMYRPSQALHFVRRWKMIENLVWAAAYNVIAISVAAGFLKFSRVLRKDVMTPSDSGIAEAAGVIVRDLLPRIKHDAHRVSAC